MNEGAFLTDAGKEAGADRGTRSQRPEHAEHAKLSELPFGRVFDPLQ